MTSTTKLLYFAAVREAVGKTEESLTLPDDVRTIAALSRWLEGHRPELKGRLGSVRFAINESFAESDDRVGPGDVVALIPPVSGG